jgi:hypothetical protein
MVSDENRATATVVALQFLELGLPAYGVGTGFA